MPEPQSIDPIVLLDVDDELGLVAAELRAVMLALDSRSLELDRIQSSGLISILDRQVQRITAVRDRIRLRPVEREIENGEAADESGEG